MLQQAALWPEVAGMEVILRVLSRALDLLEAVVLMVDGLVQFVYVWLMLKQLTSASARLEARVLCEGQLWVLRRC